MDPEHDDPSVTSALRALARHDRASMASAPHVDAALRAAVRARAAARSTRRRYAVLATAAGLAGLTFVVSQRSPAPVPSTRTRVTVGGAVPDEVTTDFLPLPNGSVPLSDGQLLRIEVPRTALSAFGRSETT